MGVTPKQNKKNTSLKVDNEQQSCIKPPSQKTQRHYRNPNKSTTSTSLPQIKENQSTQSEQARKNSEHNNMSL